MVKLNGGISITCDGVDYAGKSTLVASLKQYLIDLGYDCEVYAHPGATPLGKEIRKLVKYSLDKIGANAEALLFAADNAAFIEQILRPKLRAGKVIINDRNDITSSLVYQRVSGLDLNMLDKVHDATDDVPKIDLLLVLKADNDVIKKRMQERGVHASDRFESNPEYFDKVLNSYATFIEDNQSRLRKFVRPIADGLTTTNSFYLNANNDREEVLDEAKMHVNSLLGIK